jgi:hypothetical protein
VTVFGTHGKGIADLEVFYAVLFTFLGMALSPIMSG